jgi:phage baseplate assembly protein W
MTGPAATSDLALRSKHAFLGVGWAFPIGFNSWHDVQSAEFEEDVRQAVLIILATNSGERVMRPDFGAGLDDFVFSPITATTTEQIRVRVQEALVDWEPRIDVLDVAVTIAGERNRLEIDVHFRIRATNTLHNLVYPFYMQEGSE